MSHHELICRSCGVESSLSRIRTEADTGPRFVCPRCKGHSFGI